jgi:hypothetical protein
VEGLQKVRQGVPVAPQPFQDTDGTVTPSRPGGG